MSNLLPLNIEWMKAAYKEGSTNRNKKIMNGFKKGQKLLRLIPSYLPNFGFTIGNIYFQEKDFERAKEHLKGAISNAKLYNNEWVYGQAIALMEKIPKNYYSRKTTSQA